MGDVNDVFDKVGPPIAKNTREGGASTSTLVTAPHIIVDMREFRSELPSLLHKRGVEIEPVTLQASRRKKATSQQHRNGRWEPSTPTITLKKKLKLENEECPRHANMHVVMHFSYKTYL
ncbi:unnamed protein product [Nesidiocoris tenuis]|uniref:Uncharacterized protein n=1 Tax=Nesidiocoris tenuis TaxID=355587 RepID=A0A6H5GI93_9HEMI|nr:unnamed protein product [Nesidiocoris tenuis]